METANLTLEMLDKAMEQAQKRNMENNPYPGETFGQMLARRFPDRDHTALIKLLEGIC